MPKSAIRAPGIPLAVLTTGLALAIWMGQHTASNNRRSADEQFNAMAVRATSQLQKQLQRGEQAAVAILSAFDDEDGAIALRLSDATNPDWPRLVAASADI